MTPILAKVTAIEKRRDQYQVIVQISPKRQLRRDAEKRDGSCPGHTLSFVV